MRCLWCGLPVNGAACRRCVEPGSFDDVKGAVARLVSEHGWFPVLSAVAAAVRVRRVKRAIFGAIDADRDGYRSGEPESDADVDAAVKEATR